MLKSAVLSIVAALVTVPSSSAQEETARHRAVYEKINAAERSLAKVSAKAVFDDTPYTLTGWTDAGKLVKIVAKSPAGATTEFYLENGAPLFVFNAYRRAGEDGKPGRSIEERLYFRDGGIFKWLTTEEPAPVFHGEDYAATTELLVNQAKAFGAELRKNPAAKPTAGNALEGTFTGIEQGDYAHWNIRAKDGKERSFFILRPDASVGKALENPKSFVGKSCRVTWKKSTEDIPESGGKMEIEQILSVEWLDAK